MKNLFLTYFLFLITLSSCVYPYNVDLEDEQKYITVLEGDIIVGGVSTVNLSTVTSLYDIDPYQGVIRGRVRIEDESGRTYEPVDLPKNGLLSRSISIPTYDAPTDQRYRVVAEIEGRTYLSDWVEPLSPPKISAVEFKADEHFVRVYVSMEAGEKATGFIGLTSEETWEFHSDFLPKYDYDQSKRVYVERTLEYPNYWCWTNRYNESLVLVNHSEIPSGEIVSYPYITFTREDSRNHRKYSIKVKARTLDEKTYLFMYNVGINSSGKHDLFRPNPGEMPSNIRCESDPGVRVLGYVSASILATKRVFLDSRYAKEWDRKVGNLLFPNPNNSITMLLGRGFHPIDYMDLYDEYYAKVIHGMAWGPVRCYDCIAAGGTKDKPDFWE